MSEPEQLIAEIVSELQLRFPPPLFERWHVHCECGLWSAWFFVARLDDEHCKFTTAECTGTNPPYEFNTLEDLLLAVKLVPLPEPAKPLKPAGHRSNSTREAFLRLALSCIANDPKLGCTCDEYSWREDGGGMCPACTAAFALQNIPSEPSDSELEEATEKLRWKIRKILAPYIMVTPSDQVNAEETIDRVLHLIKSMGICILKETEK